MSKDGSHGQVKRVRIEYEDGSGISIEEQDIERMIMAGEALDMITRAKEIAKQLVQK